MYTAAVLTPTSQTTIRWLILNTFKCEKSGYIFKTPVGGTLPHHMTLNMGPLDESLNPKEILGKSCILEINSIYQDDQLGVCAARVTKAQCGDIVLHTVNDGKGHPHVTLCLKPGVKPVTSNKLFTEKLPSTVTHDLGEPFLIEAVIQEVQ